MTNCLDDSIRTLFKGGIIVMTGLAFKLIFYFVAKIIAARSLGPIDYGGIAIGLTVISLTTPVVVLGLNIGIGRNLPRYDDLEHRLGVIRSAFEVVVPFSLLVAGILWIAADTLAEVVFHDPALAPIIGMFGLMVPFAPVLRLSIGTI